MLIPRPCAEIIHGMVMDENGNSVRDEYSKAVWKALGRFANEEIAYIVLQLLLKIEMVCLWREEIFAQIKMLFKI